MIVPDFSLFYVVAKFLNVSRRISQFWTEGANSVAVGKDKKQQIVIPQKMKNESSEEPIEEISSSLSLQIMLYFNAFFDLIIIFELWASFIFKLRDYPNSMNIISSGIFIFMFLVWLIFEIVRITLGYHSNIFENVPRLFLVGVMQLFAVVFNLYFIFLQPPFTPQDVLIIFFQSTSFNLSSFSQLKLVMPYKIDVIVFIMHDLFLIAELISLALCLFFLMQKTSRRYPIFFNRDGTLKMDSEALEEQENVEQIRKQELDALLKAIGSDEIDDYEIFNPVVEDSKIEEELEENQGNEGSPEKGQAEVEIVAENEENNEEGEKNEENNEEKKEEAEELVDLEAEEKKEEEEDADAEEDLKKPGIEEVQEE